MFIEIIEENKRFQIWLRNVLVNLIRPNVTIDWADLF